MRATSSTMLSWMSAGSTICDQVASRVTRVATAPSLVSRYWRSAASIAASGSAGEPRATEVATRRIVPAPTVNRAESSSTSRIVMFTLARMVVHWPARSAIDEVGSSTST